MSLRVAMHGMIAARFQILTMIGAVLMSGSLPAVAAGLADPARDMPRLSHAVSRCTESAELISCYEALNIKPNDPDLLVAEGDALVQSKRPGEAIGVYRNALTVAALPTLVNPKIAAAQLQRRALLDTCLSQEDDAAERACESAWLPGAADEVALFKRRGSLLQAEDRESEALDAYMAAARLRPRDRAVARQIVRLGNSAGRKDAVTLTAVGAALVSLGHFSQAIGPLRQAVRAAPALATARQQLRVAERSAAAGADAGAASVDVNPPQTVSDAAASIGPFTNEAEVSRSN